MDLVDGIRVLVATLETGSMSGAAQRLGISPKLASKYMAALEQRLGTPLLARTTRRLGPTPAGERLMARAPEWLDMLAEMTGDLAETGRNLSGTLRVTAPVSYGEVIVLPLLRRFAGDHPDLAIDLRLTDSFSDLAADGIDLAIRIGTLADSALIARSLGSTTFLLVGAPGYFARAGMPARAEDLSAHSFIRDSNLRDPGHLPLILDGVERRIAIAGRFTVNSLTAARDLAMAGEGIAFCPDYLAEDALRDGRLIALPLSIAGAPRPVHALHLPVKHLPRRTRALIDYLAAPRPGATSTPP